MHTRYVVCRWTSRTQRLTLAASRTDAGEATTSCGTIFVSDLEVEGRTGLFGPCMNPNAQREVKERYAPEVCRRCIEQDKRKRAKKKRPDEGQVVIDERDGFPPLACSMHLNQTHRFRSARRSATAARTELDPRPVGSGT